MKLLGDGHKGVRLSQEELDKIACWIDLVIPYCGDYHEANAWTPEEVSRYDHFLAKRRQMEAIEADNVREYLRDNGTPDGVRVAMAGTDAARREVELAIEVLDAKGSVSAQKSGKAEPSRPAGARRAAALRARRHGPCARGQVYGRANRRPAGRDVDFRARGRVRHAYPVRGPGRQAAIHALSARRLSRRSAADYGSSRGRPGNRRLSQSGPQSL